MTASPWTPDLAEEAMRMYGQEELSVAVVARSLNTKFGTHFSRNSVMGKLKRLGLIGCDGPKAKKIRAVPDRICGARPHVDLPRATSKKAALALEPLGPVHDFPPKGTCQFMTGDPQDADWRMCGRNVETEGSHWCDAHRAVVVDKVIPAIEDKRS